MKFNVLIAALLLAALGPPPAAAAPTKSTAVAQVGEAAEIPFLPPLDTPLRYRWEKSVQRDGRQGCHGRHRIFGLKSMAKGIA